MKFILLVAEASLEKGANILLASVCLYQRATRECGPTYRIAVVVRIRQHMLCSWQDSNSSILCLSVVLISAPSTLLSSRPSWYWFPEVSDLPEAMIMKHK